MTPRDSDDSAREIVVTRRNPGSDSGNVRPVGETGEPEVPSPGALAPIRTGRARIHVDGIPSARSEDLAGMGGRLEPAATR
jgi:hypothetical protein